MDFFQHQDQARKSTSRLVVLFLIAIVCMILLTYALLIAIVKFGDTHGQHFTPSLWQPLILLGTALGVLLVVGCGSLYKISQLSSGGDAVAMMLGATEIQPTTRDFHEKRLLNIVEEMALASGVPVPPVYIIEEEGINAFAAGYSPGDAVVAVSRGCLNYLKRDEIQGVVAHEFSHILNGDMRINIRLIGIIHGIVVVSLMGAILMDAAGRGGRSSSKDDPRGGLFILGLGLYILGIVGAFFGQWIRAAVSRQREYLADASAVQFTRYPDGIGGALKKIGGLQEGSRIKHPQASEVAHMFFASGLAMKFGDLLATHPPLEDRIRRIDPHWDGEYPEVRPLVEAEEKRDEKKSKQSPLEGSLPTLPGMPQVPFPVIVGAMDETVPQPPKADTDETLTETLGDDIPPKIRKALEDAFSARAVIYSLLLDTDESVRARQWASLQAKSEPRDVALTNRLEADIRTVPDGLRLMLAHLAMPALRQMSPQQYQIFRSQVEALAAADEQISLFEFCLQSVVIHHLDSAYGLREKKRVRYRSADQLLDPIARVLAMLAWQGHADETAARRAYGAGWKALFEDGHPLAMPSRQEINLATFAEALELFREASPGLQKKLIASCLTCIQADAVITPREMDLLRAICSTLDCPVPRVTSTTPA